MDGGTSTAAFGYPLQTQAVGLVGQIVGQHDEVWFLSLDGDATNQQSVDIEVMIGLLRIAHLDGNAAAREVGLQIGACPVVSHAAVAQDERPTRIGYALLQPSGIVNLGGGHLKGRHEHD